MATYSFIEPVSITAFSTISSSGLGNNALLKSLLANEPALKPPNLLSPPFPTFVGEIESPLPDISTALELYNCRNARVALAALNYPEDRVRSAVEIAKSKYGIHRIGVVIGTSTSGLFETESAYAVFLEQNKMPDDFHFVTRHAYQGTARFLQLELGLKGPCYAISTACSSSAKALAAGQRLIASGVCDAVLVGGADTLCKLTLRGFKSLELISSERCQPMDKDRSGINIGEAAALLLLEKNTGNLEPGALLLAVGESSDAHHMSSPHPDGEGAVLAMTNALQMANLTASSIDYLNLHATATPLNDQIESLAAYRVFGNQVRCSGTKGITGHTLGAAGALETIISLLALKNQFIPGTAGLQQTEDACLCRVVKDPVPDASLHIAMSNSFGFGGNNASVIVSYNHG